LLHAKNKNNKIIENISMFGDKPCKVDIASPSALSLMLSTKAVYDLLFALMCYYW